jgi:transposase-like protein
MPRPERTLRQPNPKEIDTYKWLTIENGKCPFGGFSGVRINRRTNKPNDTLLLESKGNPIRVKTFKSLPEALLFMLQHVLLSTLQVSAQGELFVTLSKTRHPQAYNTNGTMTAEAFQADRAVVNIAEEFSFADQHIKEVQAAQRAMRAVAKAGTDATPEQKAALKAALKEVEIAIQQLEATMTIKKAPVDAKNSRRLGAGGGGKKGPALPKAKELLEGEGATATTGGPAAKPN